MCLTRGEGGLVTIEDLAGGFGVQCYHCGGGTGTHATREEAIADWNGMLRAANQGYVYWTVRDPDGHLIHTHISTEAQEAINDFLESEKVTHWIYNLGARAGYHNKGERCTPSWEHFEAEGYSCVPVVLSSPSPVPTKSVTPPVPKGEDQP